MTRTARAFLACIAGGLAWAVAEVTGGLAFLAGGVRLWRYEILPLFWAITSPVIWLVAALLIAPIMTWFDRTFRTDRLSPRRRMAARLGFMMTAGPVIEVFINRYVFIGLVGAPLYSYLVLPTFQGSGSVLSPLYYATLYLHVPIADRLLRRGAPQLSEASMSSSPDLSTARAPSMS